MEDYHNPLCSKDHCNCSTSNLVPFDDKYIPMIVPVIDIMSENIDQNRNALIDIATVLEKTNNQVIHLQQELMTQKKTVKLLITRMKQYEKIMKQYEEIMKNLQRDKVSKTVLSELINDIVS